MLPSTLPISSEWKWWELGWYTGRLPPADISIAGSEDSKFATIVAEMSFLMLDCIHKRLIDEGLVVNYVQGIARSMKGIVSDVPRVWFHARNFTAWKFDIR